MRHRAAPILTDAIRSILKLCVAMVQQPNDAVAALENIRYIADITLHLVQAEE